MIWVVISQGNMRHIMRYHTGSPKNTRQKKLHRKPSPCCGLLFVLAPCMCPLLVLSPVGPFLPSFCCPSAGHMIGLTEPPANTNLVPSPLGLLPERMIGFVSFLSPPSFAVSFFFLLHISHDIGIAISPKYSRH